MTLIPHECADRNSQSPVRCASSDGRCNTIWYKSVFKGGVYEGWETVWAFGGAEARRVASLEGWGNVACSGVPLAKNIPPFVVSCRVTVGLLRQYGGGRCLREREEISRGLASGSSIRAIAKDLERTVSTVSREVVRHGGRPAYRASQADSQAWESALRPKRCFLSIHVKLRNIVASKLILDWSPEQISGWLKIQYPDDESMRVSHETIYRSLKTAGKFATCFTHSSVVQKHFDHETAWFRAHRRVVRMTCDRTSI
jgi:hypothetical protein